MSTPQETPAVAKPVKETKAQKSERLKLEKNPWAAWDEVRQFAREGRRSVLPEWAEFYFKWWGVYTQGDGAGVTGGVGGVGALFGKPLWQATEGIWRDLGSVTVDADLGARVVTGITDELGEGDLTEVIRQRDEVLVKLLKLKSEQSGLP